jgi:hypothetical protein
MGNQSRDRVAKLDLLIILVIATAKQNDDRRLRDLFPNFVTNQIRGSLIPPWFNVCFCCRFVAVAPRNSLRLDQARCHPRLGITLIVPSFSRKAARTSSTSEHPDSLSAVLSSCSVRCDLARALFKELAVMDQQFGSSFEERFRPLALVGQRTAKGLPGP